ncbi:MAG: endonuclease/exonuclease/phosphatase family protein [Bacteroidales bacterium]|nr:endonuclease/exonuclease/phosphatase family protein [Bacteroidales bacterium]
MKKAFNILAIGITFLLITGLLFSYLSVSISPEKVWVLAFFGLIYPYLLFANLLSFLYWSIKKKRLAILVLFVILLGWNHLNNYVRISRKNSKEISNIVIVQENKNQSATSVLSYNVRLFDLYNKDNKNKSVDEFFNFMNGEDFDIICLQEVLITDMFGLSVSDIKKKLNKTKNSYVIFTGGKESRHKYGIAVFTKYPIINKGEISFKNTSNLSIFIDILIAGDTVRVYNNHLQSFRLGSDNFRFLTELEGTIEDPPMQEMRDITSRMKHAYIKRAGQAKQLSAHIHSSPYPVIVCGDFNDTPVSFTYHTIRKDLKDAFVESGLGMGKTYSQIFPSYRIDYILHSPDLESYEFKTVRKNYSDHYPVKSLLLPAEKR